MFKRDCVVSIVMKIVLFYFGFCDVCKLPRTVVYVLLHDYITCIAQVTLEVINYRHSSFTIGGFASFTFRPRPHEDDCKRKR